MGGSNARAALNREIYSVKSGAVRSRGRSRVSGESMRRKSPRLASRPVTHHPHTPAQYVRLHMIVLAYLSPNGLDRR